MDWNRYIDLHCERTQPGFLQEPLNVLSGALFFVAAYFLWKELKKQKTQPVMLYFLVIMVAVIGMGSITYHTTARMWAAIFADGLPIAIAAVTLIYLMTKHVLRANLLGVLAMAVLFIALNVAFKAHFNRGPDGYITLVPTLFLLFMVSIYMFFSKNPSFTNFAIANVIAVIAVFFRIIDMEICPYFSHGTHFMWHSLMAAFFFLVVREVIHRHRDIQ